MADMRDEAQTERIIRILKATETNLTARARSQHEASHKALAPRVVFVLIGILALANLYFVSQLTLEIRTIIANLNEMHGHVSTLSQRMSRIRDEIQAMGQEVRLMPVLREQMQSLAGQVGGLESDVGLMTGTLVEMEQRVGSMNVDVGDMALRFRQLNQKVGQIGLDVNQMARPVP
ncbi:MAG: hypothetical protein EOM91_18000 [Sphingobacteriia bacterium]|nr:hypothetical protein [Sphingobacteriia bacterium]NCC38800.1 hypothetical protein [Gammaproteobacteria bacterium]